MEVGRAVQKLLDAPEAVLVADGGEFGQWSQATLQAPHRVINGPAGSIGAALPFAAAALERAAGAGRAACVNVMIGRLPAPVFRRQDA